MIAGRGLALALKVTEPSVLAGALGRKFWRTAYLGNWPVRLKSQPMMSITALLSATFAITGLALIQII
jgi:hypothetical protein